MLHFVVAHPVGKPAKVGVHEREAAVIHDVLLGIGILVEAEQSAIGT